MCMLHKMLTNIFEPYYPYCHDKTSQRVLLQSESSEKVSHTVRRRAHMPDVLIFRPHNHMSGATTVIQYNCTALIAHTVVSLVNSSLSFSQQVSSLSPLYSIVHSSQSD